MVVKHIVDFLRVGKILNDESPPSSFVFCVRFASLQLGCCSIECKHTLNSKEVVMADIPFESREALLTATKKEAIVCGDEIREKDGGNTHACPTNHQTTAPSFQNS
ncbi:MAG: hypothetical protein UV60_C0040G0002 [Parcubacteria group bacterium GW2011_GWA2_43_11]|nr:MAG: hypothetical protein UV60_C0040G0002 [Parcubacteria group bacterium GW2011_GWA2_43_11]